MQENIKKNSIDQMCSNTAQWLKNLNEMKKTIQNFCSGWKYKEIQAEL